MRQEKVSSKSIVRPSKTGVFTWRYKKLKAKAYRESHEKCPACKDGYLIAQNSGGVNCDRCSYWFCF